MSKSSQTIFEELYEQYSEMVLQMSLGFVKGNRALAHDLSHDVFINVWKSLKNFKGNSSYKTWIYRITVNTCLKHLRDDGSKIQVSIDEIDKAEVATDGPADAPHKMLYEAIGQLNKVDRLIIMMVLNDLEYAEIASVMGIREGNLRVKIHRVKKNLRDLLANEE